MNISTYGTIDVVTMMPLGYQTFLSVDGAGGQLKGASLELSV